MRAAQDADRPGATADQPGTVLYDGYVHEYVDDELVGVAKRRRAFAFAENSVVEHLHSTYGKAPDDPIYSQQGARMRASSSLFRRRRRLWAPWAVCP